VRPTKVSDLHHEVELGVVIEKVTRNVTVADAMSFVAGYRLCLDMTVLTLPSPLPPPLLLFHYLSMSLHLGALPSLLGT